MSSARVLAVQRGPARVVLDDETPSGRRPVAFESMTGHAVLWHDLAVTHPYRDAVSWLVEWPPLSVTGESEQARRVDFSLAEEL